MNMALTRDFKETIRARVKRDPGFRKALLREGIENFLSGDVETGKIILRDFINATIGFTKLSDATHRSAKSLMRMLGPRGNPQARNLFEIVAYLQHAEGVRFELRPRRSPHAESTLHPLEPADRPLSPADEYFWRWDSLKRSLEQVDAK
jgi:DNA-binding phage protein